MSDALRTAISFACALPRGQIFQHIIVIFSEELDKLFAPSIDMFLHLLGFLRPLLFLQSNLTINLHHHILIPVYLGLGKLPPLLYRFTPLQEIAIVVEDGFDLNRGEPEELFCYLLCLSDEHFKVVVCLSMAALEVRQRLSFPQLLLHPFLLNIVPFDELEASLQQEVELLSLQIHLLFHAPHLLFVLFLVACYLARSNDAYFSLQLALERVVLSQS